MSEVPDWLPDWRDETSYDIPGPEDWAAWAWEFLRRNPEYQKAWQENYVDGPLAWHQEMVETSSDDDTRRIHFENCDRFDCKICEPPAFPGETKEEYLSRVEESTMTPLGVHLARRFGLRRGHLQNPADPKRAVDFSFESSEGPRSRDWESVSAYGEELKDGIIHLREGIYFSAGLWPESPEQVVVKFNLEWPLEMQWRRISRNLEHNQKRLMQEGKISVQDPKNIVAKYPSHLRLLDADAHGANHSEMAKVLFPEKSNEYGDQQGKQTVKNRLRAARNMRDEGYIYLCFKSW